LVQTHTAHGAQCSWTTGSTSRHSLG
jgi:hypothetical protein